MTYKKRMFLFLTVNAIFNIGANLAHPVTPTIFTSLNLGSYMFGYALAIMMVVNFSFSPFWGKINGYISSRTSMLICGCGYAVGQLLFGLARTEGQFYIARMFAGAFTGGAFVSFMTYIVNTAPDAQSRGLYLTISATMQSVCGAFGYFIGGVLGVYDTYAPIWLQVGTLATCGVLFYVICENDASIDIKELKMKTLVKEANPLAAFLSSRQFMTSILAVLFAMCCLQNLSFTMFDQSFNYYITDQFAFPSSYNGFIKGGMGLIALLANSTICIWLIKKTDVKRSIIGVFTLCSIGMLGSILINDIVPFVVCNIVMFAFNSVSMPLLQDLVASRAEEGGDSNLIMGFYNAMKSFGGIIGAFVAGTVYAINPKYPFVVGFAGFSLAVVMSVIYYTGSKKAKKA